MCYFSSLPLLMLLEEKSELCSLFHLFREFAPYVVEHLLCMCLLLFRPANSRSKRLDTLVDVLDTLFEGLVVVLWFFHLDSFYYRS